MSAEPTLAEQLREMIVPPACVELIEQAAVRLDDLERQIAKVQYWRDRHCRESEQHAQRSGENWKAWKAAERQLATVAQEECERCATICEEQNKFTPWQDKEHYKMAAQCAYAIRALAPHAKQEQDPGESAITLPDLTTRMYSHAGKEPGAAPAPIPTERTPLDAAIKIAELERECARLQRELEQVCDGARGSMRNKDTHIEALQKDNARLRAVAEAAKAWMDHRIETDWDALVAAVRALERDEVKS
jgi:hypothetical protein